MIEPVFKIKTHRGTSREGGGVKSAVKTAPVRANGAKGGRPRKTPRAA